MFPISHWILIYLATLINSEYCWCCSEFLVTWVVLLAWSMPFVDLFWRLLTADRNSAVRSREVALVEDSSGFWKAVAMTSPPPLLWSTSEMFVSVGISKVWVTPVWDGGTKKTLGWFRLSPDQSKTEEGPFKTLFPAASASGRCSDSEPCLLRRVIIR